MARPRRPIVAFPAVILMMAMGVVAHPARIARTGGQDAVLSRELVVGRPITPAAVVRTAVRAESCPDPTTCSLSIA